MALEDVTRESIRRALQEFDRVGRETMLNRYLGGRSRTWYIEESYDLKLICRAAHEIQGLGPLPPGPGTFKTYDARDYLESLGIRVIEVKSK